MKPDDFRASPSGRLVPTIGGQWAFVPHPLPPALDPGPLLTLASEAAARLGELSGVGRTLPNPHLLIGPFRRREAVASSRIEGTITTLSDLFLYEAEAREPIAQDAREVYNYVLALDHAIKRLNELPVSLRLIREVHHILLLDVGLQRGATQPGEFRTDQNWIAGVGVAIEDARFVPPPPQELMPALSAFEHYIHEPPPPNLPLLVRVALIHYQFEAIHPFPDGNGRAGRLLIPLLLMAAGALSQPLFYLSAYFEKHRQRYYELLLAVSRDGAWGEWIGFFLNGVIEQCADATARSDRLLALRDRYRDQVRQARESALLPQLIDHLFEAPIISIPSAARHLGVTYRAARGQVGRLVEAGILRALETRRPRLYRADEIILIVQ